VALFTRLVLFRLLLRLARGTRAGLDDQLILALRGPVVWTLILATVGWSLQTLALAPTLEFVLLGLLQTLVIGILCAAALRVGTIFLEAMSRNQERFTWIQPKTLPVLRIAWQVLVVGGSLYFLLAAWHVNVTSWLASAGVLGLAIGFAAKDTLANLFAGVFILADAPYKIGDFVILDNNLRGRITDIGVRSSRLLTRDDIEVTVPNAVIANGKIVNETGGPDRKMRVRVPVDVSYDSDPDHVREIMLGCVEGVTNLSPQPEPRVRFRAFGESGLRFELLAWIEEPVYRGRVVDELNTRIFKAFRSAGIEIPYTKRDVYIRQMPATDTGAPR
jgi:MscS family membrane protein